MLRGIRVRITFIAAAAVLVVLVLTAALLLMTQRRILTDNLDEALDVHATELARSGVVADGVLSAFGDDDSIAQIVSLGGRVLASTPNLTGYEALRPPADGANRQRRTEQVFAGEAAYRVLALVTDETVVHVGAPTDDLDESVVALRRGLIGMIPIVTAVLAAVIWWLVGRTLRPVEAIRTEVATISGGSLHRRVPEPDSDDEIQRLAVTMNSMLDRIERASAGQQRFVADASHELRSPLTRMRSELEVDLAHPETADLLATHRSVLDEAVEMQRLVDDLLVVARFDGDPSTPMSVTVVDLDDVVMREVGRFDTTVMDCRSVSAAQVRGDAAQLERMVRNLLENAVRHARATIVVTLGERDGLVELTITDDGPGIAAEHRERVFERFARVDDARSQSDGGTGLGLPIARAITERHSGTIVIDASASDGARFVVRLPRAPID